MRKILNRILIVIPAVALQALWLLLLTKWLAPYSALIASLLSIVAVFLVLFIVIKRDESTYKLLWLLAILTIPLVGTLLYLCFGNKRTAKPLRRQLESVSKSNDPPASSNWRDALRRREAHGADASLAGGEDPVSPL